MTGAFLGIKFHYCGALEKSNSKIQGRDAIIIDNIHVGSPAYKSDLKEGDIIFNFGKNNTPVNMNLSFFDYIYTKNQMQRFILNILKIIALNIDYPLK